MISLKSKPISRVAAAIFAVAVLAGGVQLVNAATGAGQKAQILPKAGEGAPAEFQAWLEGVYSEGRDKGISPATLKNALDGLTPIKRVVELDRKQPEFVQTFDQYIDKRVSDWRVRTGRERLAENRQMLERIGGAYGVQPRFIVALWGIETSFGRATGGFSVVRALATLAFDPRRSDYFRRELFNALRIIDEGHITASAMKGSWAGAMGQNQFMPSSFLNFAVDHNGDGKRDIWGTRADVFASTANYLAKSGWRDDQTWGRRVKLPPAFDMAAHMPADPPRGCRALKKLSVERTLPEWSKLGVTRADGRPLPTRPLSASLVQPDGPEGPTLVVYNNFRVTLRWNCSVSFAAAVGILAEKLR